MTEEAKPVPLHYGAFDVKGRIVPSRGLESQLRMMSLLCSRCAIARENMEAERGLHPSDLAHLLTEGYRVDPVKFESLTETLKRNGGTL